MLVGEKKKLHSGFQTSVLSFEMNMYLSDL